ncbi:sugar phosphate isomerase/epimerase family protein [Galbibacter pacificus]|uniref:Sugar phosphate isomerase/epimerase n=1 Tax=Galbibacter pacificus TaxID=2996052 RepID=A0ABT6FQU4_9FLAO|nr:sugar phosphate isomerase/epimerase [Galbibacter pacificus]MDG3581880.1 sugar phosphate isomerase/epimerase [Galbibacter pacificus]MDG3585646.1 sugar phosphate isomerase/epimerase [Galbibacter pacificus]
MKFTHLKRAIKTFMAFSFILLSACGNNAFQDKFGGLALYTVRDDMGKNTEVTLDSVANAGYKYVEAAGYNNGKFYNMTPEAFKNLLAEKGLTPISTHQGSATLDNIDQEIADVKAAGFTYFVIPVPPMGHFKYNAETKTMGMDPDLDFMVNFLTTVGKKCKEAGLQLLYHNHDFEYKKNENGIVPIEYFLENTDPEYVNFQMDIFWVTKAGADPVKYFEKYPGRFKLWHVKDMSKDGKFAPVGEGTIDFGKILAKKELSGMEYYLVEQDQTFYHTPLEAIKISHNGLKEFGFE